MGDLDRELLLGYLMNALEPDEIVRVERELLRRPELRAELASLKAELRPLSQAYESVDPPRNLARRTCSQIWAKVDRLESSESPNHQEKNLDTAFNTAFRSPVLSHDTLSKSRQLDEIITVSPNLGSITEPFPPAPHFVTTNNTDSDSAKDKTPVAEQKPVVTGTTKTKPIVKSIKTVPSKNGWRLFDLVGSIVVGIIIAVIAYPAINYAANRTKTMVTQSKIKEFEGGVGIYTELQGAPHEAEQVPVYNGVNLALSGWQKVEPSQLPILQIGDDHRLNIHRLNTTSEQSIPSPELDSFKPTADTVPLIARDRRDVVILGQAPRNAEGERNRINVDPRDFSGDILLNDVGNIVPVRNGSQLHTAYGQNVLFQNGGVFLRDLPVFPKPKTDE